MTATNHAVIGGIIAATVSNPVVGIALAFMSHFMLDSLPHFGVEGAGELLEKSRGKLFLSVLFGDAVLLLALTAALITFQPAGLPYILAGMLAAIAPDIVWGYRLFNEARTRTVAKSGWLTNFHRDIQWSERPWGIYVEVVWFLIFGSVFYTVLF